MPRNACSKYSPQYTMQLLDQVSEHTQLIHSLPCSESHLVAQSRMWLFDMSPGDRLSTFPQYSS